MMRPVLAVLLLLIPAARAEPGDRAMVAAAEPLAAEAGLRALRAGGNAVDAAIAVQAVLTVIEPQSSGIGGGAFLLRYDGAARTVTSYDGRETAPAAARPDLFIGPDGQPVTPEAAALGGRAVGVPGVLRMLEMAHKAHGRRPWAELFEPAIALAESGFPVPPRLAAAVAADAEHLKRQPAARALFLPDGVPVAAGTVVRNPELGRTLRLVARHGADAIMTGAVAADIAAAVRTDAEPGLLTTDDLAAYQPRERPPVCQPYRGRLVCGMGQPGGGVTVAQTLALLQRFDLPALDPAGADAAQLLLEAERLALADRDAYLADTDLVPAPVSGLLAPAYATARAQLIDPDRAASSVRAGNPDWAAPPPQPPQPEHGTSQVAVVDAAGDAVSMTTTVNDAFGSRLLVHGFFLNDELADFSLTPQVGGRPVANRVQPGKRPRSAMSPSLVLGPDGRLLATLGSPGGGRIIGYVVQAIVGLVDWGLDPVRDVALPHVEATSAGVWLEANSPAERLAEALGARGQAVQVAPLVSGLQVITVGPDGLRGASDPRREGVAIGD